MAPVSRRSASSTTASGLPAKRRLVNTSSVTNRRRMVTPFCRTALLPSRGKPAKSAGTGKAWRNANRTKVRSLRQSGSRELGLRALRLRKGFQAGGRNGIDPAEAPQCAAAKTHFGEVVEHGRHLLDVGHGG